MNTLPENSRQGRIGAEPRSNCMVCGSPGQPFYSGLKDPFFDAPGEWDSVKCVNPECGLVWLDPMPVEQDLHRAYQEYFTHESEESRRAELGEVAGRGGWAQRLHDSVRRSYLAGRYGYGGKAGSGGSLRKTLAYLNPAWKAGFDAEVFYLPAHAGGRWLEIGCGQGRMLEKMKSWGWDVEGLDLDPAAVENTRKRGLKVNQGSLIEQAYPDDSFDAVVMNHVIEHVYDPRQLLKEIHRVLKPGGSYVAITPNIESLGVKRFKHADVMFMDSPRHLYVFTPASLDKLAEQAGFARRRVMTSIKQAGTLYMSDRAIERSGHYAIGAPGLKDRIGAKGTQLAEWALLNVRPGLGEEVVLIAQK